MNLYQCQKKAEDIGYDKAKFYAMFPTGLIECQWLDAYMGLFKAKAKGMDNGFLTVGQIDEMFPDLLCTEPYVEEDEE